MKYSTIENWEDFRHDGLLYFTQRINEMLFHYTDHVYKAPVLNSFLLVDEFIKTAKLVKEGTINENHLKQIMAEFQDSFKKDIIIKEHLDENEKDQLLQKVNSSTINGQIQMMQYIQYVLRDYNEWCKQYLREIVPKEKEKKKIESALRCYIPCLIAAGYSHEFIYYYNREVFFKKPVRSLDSLDVFLNRFDFEKKDYNVFIAIDKEATAFQEVLEKRLKVNFGPFDDETELKYDVSKYHLVMIEIKAFDEQSAAWKAYNKLNIFFLYYRFLAEQKDSWFFPKAKVTVDGSVTAFVNLKDYGLNYSKSKDRELIATHSDVLISSLQTHAKESYLWINRAISAHNIAIDDLDIRNRFLNLWSTLEIVFVSDKDDGKLAEIIKKAVPILQKDYFFYLFYSIVSDIEEVIDGKILSTIIDSIEDAEKSNGLIYIIALKKYGDQRKKLYEALDKYPLIRSRISQLNEICSCKKLLQESLNNYTQRIQWHITRLYRTRNTIIHSGKTPDYLRELVEHLHSYSDECLLELIVLLAHNSRLGTLSNAIISIQLRVEKSNALLNSKSPVTKDDIDYLLDLINET